MRCSVAPSRFASLALLVTATALTAAHADDWRQFRKDEWHRALTKDRSPLPLTEVWTWHPGLGVQHAVAYEGAALVVGQSMDARTKSVTHFVHSLDLRSGHTLWKQPIPRGGDGPHGQVSISEGGNVYVLHPKEKDPQHLKEVFTLWGEEGPTPPRLPFSAFRSKDGAPIPLPDPALDPDLGPQITQPVHTFLFHPPFAHESTLPIPDQDQGAISPLLHVGREIIATSDWDMVSRWTLDGLKVLVDRTRIRHPAPEHTDPGLVPILRFRGYPVCNTSNGLFIADDQTQRCMFTLLPNGAVPWHVDLKWTAGIPASDQDAIYLNVGTPAARETILALNAKTGEALWQFPMTTNADKTYLQGRKRSRVKEIYAGDPFREPQNQPARPGSNRPGGVPPRRPGDLPRLDPRRFRMIETKVQFGPRAPGAPGHKDNGGLVLRGDVVYGETLSKISAVNRRTGKGLWVHKLEAPAELGSMVGTPDYLLLAYKALGRPYLTALRYEDGTKLWSMPLPYLAPRTDLIASQGMILLADGIDLRAFAPAERTFRMAIDSNAAADYRLQDTENVWDQAPPMPPSDAEPIPQNPSAKLFPEPVAEIKDGTVGDASVLRLTWGADVEALIQQVRQRRALIRNRPLLVSLSWLDGTRARLQGVRGDAWSPQEVARFADACRMLGLAGATYLDVAPEVNVYLSRYPARLTEVRRLLQRVVGEVRKSSQARVLASFNAEVFAGRYGKGRLLPFGELPPQTAELQSALLPLLQDTDFVGFSLRPRTGFSSGAEIPFDYLQELKRRCEDRPVLITSLSSPITEKDALPDTMQALFVKRLLQACYWLDSPLVACPELIADEAGERTEAALRIGKGLGAAERPGMDAWRHTFSWRPVGKLTSTLAGKGKPRDREEEDPEAETR